MTQPKVETYYRNGARWYSHPLANDFVDDAARHANGQPWSPLAIGVTSVLDSLNKPALVTWAAKMAAAFAVEAKDSWENLNKTAAIELIQNASKRYAREAAEIGTNAHAVAESIGNYAMGGAKPVITGDDIPWATSYLRFLKEMKAKPMLLEQTVWNHTLGYAGTFDGVYELDGKVVMIDTKTGKSGIYPETALQQVAYCHGECIVDPNGVETEMPKIEAAYALWLRPEGYALHPLDVTESTWQAFQHLVEITRWKNDVGSLAVRKPINPAPIRK